MLIFLNKLFNHSQYIPHGHCYLWQPSLVRLHLLADFFIAIAYFSIPIMLVYFVNKRKDVPFSKVFILFSLFIICCGFIHVMGVVTLWYPVYWLSGLVKALTALVSILTAFELFPVIPLALALPSPEKLQVMNTELKKEIKDKKEAQKKLFLLNQELEDRVKKRTQEIENINNYLQDKLKIEQLIVNISNSFLAIQYEYFTDHFSEILKKISLTLNYDHSYLIFFESCCDLNEQYSFPSENETINLDQDLPIIVDDMQGLIPIIYNINHGHNHQKLSQQPYVIKHNINSILAIPLVVKGTLNGVLIFSCRHENSMENSVELDNLTLIGDILVSAIASYGMNKKLQNQNQELKRSNEELEQFAYVASHDLQEPLRTISNFTDILKEEYGDIFDDTGKEYLDFIVSSSFKMKLLIKDLLALSRVDRKQDIFVVTNLNDVLREVKIMLDNAIERKNAIIECENLPAVQGDKVQLTQLWLNLISNALKFNQLDKQIKIKIGVTSQDNYWLFYIKDNGIGIKSEYKEKIFVIFQRLNSRYEGTGIGLALCRKIVNRHGGQIWVDSEVGKGSTFYLTMPKIHNLNFTI